MRKTKRDREMYRSSVGDMNFLLVFDDRHIEETSKYIECCLSAIVNIRLKSHSCVEHFSLSVLAK